jgi:hypothetical protein
MSTWEEVGALTWEEAGAYTWQELFGYELSIEIAGVAIGSPRRDSFSIQHRLEERSTADFQIIDKGDGYAFEYGQEVIIRDIDSDIIFGGIISEAKKEQLTPPWASCIHHIACTDYHALADRRVFLAAYEETTGADIVYDVLDVLSEEGVTEGEIQAGEDLENLSFNRVMCSEALEKAAELCGFTWFIDQEKRLYFVARGTYSAAWDIDSTGAHIRQRSLEVVAGNPEYRNVQYIQGGQALTSTQTETFVGDGTARSFALRYPPAKQPTITLNGAAQTIGIKADTTGYDWYWSKGDLILAQDISGTVLEPEDELVVQYVGSYKLIAKASQASEITRQALAQGFGSGKIEHVAKDAAVESQDSAMAMARAKLLHYARIGTKVRYETFDSGLAAGVLQEIDYPVAGLDAIQALITAIEITSEGGKLLYRVEACDGPVEDSWEKIFCRLADETKRSSSESLGEADVVQGLEEFSKVWTSSDHPNPFLAVYPGSATPADVDFPCLADDDKLSYCVLYTGGIEFFRKPITSQTIGATQIDTICLILATEANGTVISHVGLWGGDTCSATAGSGIEMEKHAYVKTKNSLESLQLNFTDTYEA